MPICNPTVRPENWKPSQPAKERIERACQSEKLKRAYNRVMERHQELTSYEPASEEPKEPREPRYRGPF